MSETIHKAFSGDVSIEAGERAVVATISTAVVDRDGEVLIPQGCNSRDFEKSPSVFLGHDYYTLPVGKCAAIRRTPEAIVAKTVFAARPADFPAGQEWLPDTIFSLFQQGVLKGFSVGFLPVESRPASERDKTKFGEGCRRVYSKWNLLEYSVAPIPANPEAVAVAVSKGFCRASTAKALFGDSIDLTAPDGSTPKAGEDDVPPVSAVVREPSGELHAGEVVGESAAETPAAPVPEPEAKAAEPKPPAPPVEPQVPTPPPIKPKRLTVFVDAPEPVRKRVNVVQVAAHAVAKAKGRIYADH